MLTRCCRSLGADENPALRGDALHRRGVGLVVAGPSEDDLQARSVRLADATYAPNYM